MQSDLDQNFTRFKVAVEFWLGRLGLHDWHVHVSAVRFEKAWRDMKARVHLNWQNRIAEIQLNTANKDFSEPVEDLAKHEVLHILLAPALYGAATMQSGDHPIVDSEEHAIIRRLMKLL